jgi:dihydroorotate dehydrogenase (NAD+) catalytic subunit
MISKMELELRKPLMNAAGTLGFVPDARLPLPWEEFGAFVTNPISWRPRTSADEPRLLEYAGGFLLHTGLPNPGFEAALSQFGSRWEDGPVPIIVHLMADRPEETKKMVRLLESAGNVVAVELGFAPLLADDNILLALEMSVGELPIVVCLPAQQVLRLGGRAVREGAAAISLAAPRGSLYQDNRGLMGRLYGTSLLPVSLQLVRDAAQAGIPIIGAGGVFSTDDAEAMMVAGAIGVQIDARLWLPQPIKKASP